METLQFARLSQSSYMMKCLSAGIKIQYNAVESQGDSLTSDPADYITQATTVKGLTQELRKRKHMPQTGVILYKTRDQWKTLTEAVEVPENRTLQIKLVKSTGQFSSLHLQIALTSPWLIPKWKAKPRHKQDLFWHYKMKCSGAFIFASSSELSFLISRTAFVLIGRVYCSLLQLKLPCFEKLLKGNAPNSL